MISVIPGINGAGKSSIAGAGIRSAGGDYVNADETAHRLMGAGRTFCQLLHEAIDQGREVRIFFCGLASPELHIERVAARVSIGSHDIPEAKIRERWTGAIHNMLGLIPRCAGVRVFDNSEPSDRSGPRPICLFSLVGDQFDSLPVDSMPEWAKPFASAAIKRALS